ncbi:DNA topoisomerase IB [Caulobacter sp. SLTY]|uniref:DNA topoisomerase IB n=1 Tax=Caulobacter sp. SLTY TaxID=2683262 RepID=UPI001411BDA0|nr:DNA topoisomerase IB [Caulobacter sp. SLTY]NBB14934.1 DNA topoisomerase IB [Caulobacter sp. SLTY]
MPLDTANLPEDLPEGLIYCSDEGPGIRRRKTAKGFTYLDDRGAPVTAAATIDRIEKLVIPPAWTDVWIAPRPGCHIQATGRDVKGRKQYRYHDDWRAHRDEGKYGRVAAFGRALPALRKRVEADLRKRGLPREKVLAAVVSLLEQTLIRVGNDEYAKTNKSFGLTTLRDKHAKLSAAGGRFEFVGKSGKTHSTAFHDRRLARIVKACQDLRGQRLFQYQDETGEIRPVMSGDVNDYLRAATGQEFTAKDFRTWAGTLEAARILCVQGDTTATKATVTACVKDVAKRLGNTPAVCRKAYIHPAITEAFEKRTLAVKPGKSDRAFETAVIRLLEKVA